ncbi:hypothetical protein LCGC14_2094580 [marine sediment metagenome]|uniref:Uncharacterized protein n=1 Tax=marine sediment metagenome TaxID=412755 RepID=A0A0F9EZ26_9ZZZZ
MLALAEIVSDVTQPAAREKPEKPLTATDSHDWRVELPEIPPMFKAVPAVAERVLKR